MSASENDPASVMNYNFDPAKAPVSAQLLPDRHTNIGYNAIDHWVDNPDTHGNLDFYWEGNDPSVPSVVPISNLVSRFCKRFQ